LEATIGSDIQLFDRQLDFDIIKRKITQIVNSYANQLVKAMQDKIFRMDLQAAKTRAQVLGSLLLIPEIVHYLNSHLKELIEIQLRSLAVAERNEQFSHFSFDAADMEGVKKLLDRLQRGSYESYFAGYLKFKEIFDQECGYFIEQITKVQTSRERDSIFHFMTALNQYDDLIIDRRADAQSPRLVSRCRQGFEEFLEHEIWTCQVNVDRGIEVKLTHNRVQSLRMGLKILIHTTNNTRSKMKLQEFLQECEVCEEKAEIFLKKIEEDLKVLASHDLFASQDMGQIFDRLERLRQNSGHSTYGRRLPFNSDGEISYDAIKSELKNQLSTAAERIQKILVSSEPDYKSCLNAILNMRELFVYFPDFKDIYIHQKILFVVTSERNRISELVGDLFRFRKFKDLNRNILLAASMDEELLKKVHLPEIPLLLIQVRTNFRSELTALTERMLRGNASTASHVETILTLKQCESQMSRFDFRFLAFDHIGEYLVTLSNKKVDMYQLGKILSERGTRGMEVIEQYPEFQAGLIRKINPATSLEDAVNNFAKLNPTLSLSSIIKLGTLFSRQYEAFLREYLEGYGDSSSTSKPLHRLVEDVRHQAQKCRSNPSPEDIVRILSGIFATWTVMSSSQMFISSSYDPQCLIKPHPTQLIAIFQLLGINSADGYWTICRDQAAGLIRKVLEAYLIQVS
jgi:hypothetical protein